MSLRKLYVVTARVDTINFMGKGGDQRYRGECQVPTFLLDARSGQINSDKEAIKIAREIIDPLKMTGVHVSVHKVDIPFLDDLKSDLDTGIEALKGDSNDAEHEALWGITETVARFLDLDWDALEREITGEDE